MTSPAVEKQSQEIAKVRPVRGQTLSTDQTVVGVLNGMRDSIEKVLSKGLTSARLIRQVILACRKNPRLLECDQMSFADAVLSAAEKSLEIGYHAHLIPYKRECQLQPDYKGLIDLARRTGSVKLFYAMAVLKHDEFIHKEGLNRVLEHTPNHAVPYHPIHNPLAFVYARVQFSDGVDDFEVLTAKQVEDVRSRSRAANDGPWVTDYIEMARKTAIKKMSKRMPMSVEFRDLVDLDDSEYQDHGAPVKTKLHLRAETLSPKDASFENGGAGNGGKPALEAPLPAAARGVPGLAGEELPEAHDPMAEDIQQEMDPAPEPQPPPAKRGRPAKPQAPPAAAPALVGVAWAPGDLIREIKRVAVLVPSRKLPPAWETLPEGGLVDLLEWLKEGLPVTVAP